MEAVQLADKSVVFLTATIASSGTISNAILLHGCTAVAFQTPAAITGTSITFQGSIDQGVTFKQIRNDLGSAITYTVAVDGSYPMDPNIFAAYDQIKIVMVLQAAERLILIKPFAI